MTSDNEKNCSSLRDAENPNNGHEDTEKEKKNETPSTKNESDSVSQENGKIDDDNKNQEEREAAKPLVRSSTRLSDDAIGNKDGNQHDEEKDAFSNYAEDDCGAETSSRLAIFKAADQPVEKEIPVHREERPNRLESIKLQQQQQQEARQQQDLPVSRRMSCRDTETGQSRLEAIKQEQKREILHADDTAQVSPRSFPSLAEEVSSNPKLPRGSGSFMASQNGATNQTRSDDDSSTTTPSHPPTPSSSHETSQTMHSVISLPGAYSVQGTATPQSSLDFSTLSQQELSRNSHEPDLASRIGATIGGGQEQETFLVTAEVVDHDREQAMVERLRQLEMGLQSETLRPTVDATEVVLAGDDENSDEENSPPDNTASSQDEWCYQASKNVKQTLCPTLVLALFLGIVLAVTLTVFPKKGNQIIPVHGDNTTTYVAPNEEELRILEQAGLKTFVFYMNITKKWQELQQRFNSTLTILAFTDVAHDPHMEWFYPSGVERDATLIAHLHFVLEHHMFLGTLEGVRDKFPSFANSTELIMLSDLPVDVLRLQDFDQDRLTGNEFTFLPSIADKNASAVFVPNLFRYENVVVHAMNLMLIYKHPSLCIDDGIAHNDKIRQRGANLGSEILVANGVKGEHQGYFTYFAPTNAAFEKLPPGLVANLLTEPSTVQEQRFARDLFATHAAPGLLPEEFFGDRVSRVFPSFGSMALVMSKDEEGSWWVINVEDNVNVRAKVVESNLPLVRVVVHFVDNLLLPESRIAELDNQGN